MAPISTVPPTKATRPTRPRLHWRFALGTIRRLPQGLLSRAAGLIADLPLPRLARGPVLGTFAWLTGIEVAEAEHPLSDYRSVNAFFVRRLRSGARVWPEAPGVVASPVDGVLGQLGSIDEGTLVQAKGLTYRTAELLADPRGAARFEAGTFVTIYLAPRHYHRIHAPVTGKVAWARHVPGRLLPVNDPAVASIPGLFARNERLAAGIETAAGPVGLVAVGAYNVGRISAAFDPAWGRERPWITNRAGPPSPDRRYFPKVPVDIGDEFMAFHLGSTIVLLLGPRAALEPGLEPGQEIEAGRILARWRTRSHLGR
jgi:phosphatidylserine decarboxylase